MKCPHCNSKISDTDTKINLVMDKFDFNKVHKAMVALDWRWRTEGVPTIYSMKETARGLLEDAAINEFSNVLSGGFQAKKHSDGELELSFVVSESHSHEDY